VRAQRTTPSQIKNTKAHYTQSQQLNEVPAQYHPFSVAPCQQFFGRRSRQLFQRK
jgi:hypothetical protein